MPRRNDIRKILIIGSGPIVIGQACEFDYSGTQACKALREDGYEVVLINSNPATIMTDPETADRTYVEPITWQHVQKIIEAERPDALLPTLGGQTGLNVAMDLVSRGILQQLGVELIGAKEEVIAKAEERDSFKKAMLKIGLDVPKSRIVHSIDDARDAVREIGLPMIIRASFTLGGTGGGVAYNKEEFESKVRHGLMMSPVHEVLLEESIIGWKEFEMEVMRDVADNVVIVCSIENFDPMGVHTGDSITVAPAQTLTDKEYQRMRDATIACIREIGVETGGSNVQFAIHPATGRMVIIEMNPRVSRSSALASKATGFPIAKIAAKLAVGYRLDEIPNDITRETLACFEPTIDYVVTKIPRWTFEKFVDADPTLTVQMKSVGETMAIGRTFKESLQKAIRGLEIGHFGLGGGKKDRWETPKQPSMHEIRRKLSVPNDERIFFIRYAFKAGFSVEEIRELTEIDPWFLRNIRDLVAVEDEIRKVGRLDDASAELVRTAKRNGYSDRQLAFWWNASEMEVRLRRKRLGIEATFKQVDTCAAEFEAYTPYYYSTYEQEDETPPKSPDRKRIMILGGGPNRIGQGIEFDYCCCHAAFALAELGIESIMVNSNPETVSTDYDTSDLLFFEPLTTEDVLNICDRMQPDGVIVQFGGQTPLNLARGLEAAGVKIIGTSPDMIDVAEDRERFQVMLQKVGLRQPPNGIATDVEGARTVARRIGYPVLVRPSYVLGGRAMEICDDEASLNRYMNEAVDASPDRPVLIDKFLEDAIEVDVDAISDGQTTLIGGVMEHIEEAGVHSGDSACSLPPYSLSAPVVDEIKQATYALARELAVRGLMNIQFAVKAVEGRHVVYVLEVNPLRQPHRPLRLEGDRAAAGEDRGQGHGGRLAGRSGSARRNLAATHFGQGKRVSVFAVLRRRHYFGAGDAIHGRGHGDRREIPPGLRQESDRGRHLPPDGGDRLYQHDPRPQASDDRTGPPLAGARIQAGLHVRHGPCALRRGDRGRNRPQAAGRPSQPARQDGQRRNSIHLQHAQRQRCADRRGTNPLRRRRLRRPLRHDDSRLPGRREGAGSLRQRSRAARARPAGLGHDRPTLRRRGTVSAVVNVRCVEQTAFASV